MERVCALQRGVWVFEGCGDPKWGRTILFYISKMMVDPRRKSRLGYLNHHMALKKSMKCDGKKHENKTNIFDTFTKYLWFENNFIFSILEHYNFTFSEYL